MARVNDLIGQKFGKLTVVKRLENNKHGGTMWLCECECGNERTVMGQCLLNGDTKSCGCINKERVTKHGLKGSRIYTIYQNMKSRCHNKNDKDYFKYGQRGIKVCQEWSDDFINFKNDMYESYLKHCEEFGEKETTLDRKDVDGDYYPNNCRWATNKEQSNNRRNTISIEIDGVCKTLLEIVFEHYNIKRCTFYSWFKKGFSENELLEKIKNYKGGDC